MKYLFYGQQQQILLLYVAAWTSKIIYKVAFISLKKQKGVSVLQSLRGLCLNKSRKVIPTYVS